MEVLLKTKQSNNPMFDFLNFNSNLHPFYRYILSMIKSRRYTPQPQPKPSSQCNQQPTVSGSQHSSSNIAAVKRQPVASVVIDHSSENESEDDVSTDDSDEDSSGYLHPLLAGATSSTHSPSKCAGEENSTAGLTLQQSKNNKQVGANTNDSSDSSVQESLEEKQKIASMLQICQHNAFKSLCNEQLGQVSVIPPPPDLQMLVDRVAKQVAANAEPTVFEENLRQRQLTEMSGSSSKPMTDGSDIFQCLIDSKSYFLWPADMNHVYYRLKKYFFGECLRTFGCLDPEEEARKKEEAMKGLQTKKAAAVARVKKRPSGPVKFSLSEGAKKLKLKREAAAAASSTKVSSHGNALPYEPSDDSDWEVDEFGGAAAAESILQDDDEERNSQPADDEKMTSMSSCKDKRITERLSDNNKDSDSALRAMTQFLSELEAKHGAGDVKLLDCGRELPASSALAPRAHPSLAADVLDDSDLPMSQYEKALQAERKKKACMFLQRLKESSGLQSTTSHSSKDSVD